MPSIDLAGFVACCLLGVLTMFQIALALGAPWGAYAMGGAYPGAFPPSMRIVALVQVAIYGVIALIIATRVGWISAPFRGLAGPLMWAIAALFFVATILNLISSSNVERMLWTPVAALLCLACVRLAIGD